jgi:hypothetical protein
MSKYTFINLLMMQHTANYILSYTKTLSPFSSCRWINPAKQGKVRLQMAAFSVAGLHEYCFPHSENGL